MVEPAGQAPGPRPRPSPPRARARGGCGSPWTWPARPSRCRSSRPARCRTPSREPRLASHPVRRRRSRPVQRQRRLVDGAASRRLPVATGGRRAAWAGGPARTGWFASTATVPRGVPVPDRFATTARGRCAARLVAGPRHAPRRQPRTARPVRATGSPVTRRRTPCTRWVRAAAARAAGSWRVASSTSTRQAPAVRVPTISCTLTSNAGEVHCSVRRAVPACQRTTFAGPRCGNTEPRGLRQLDARPLQARLR